MAGQGLLKHLATVGEKLGIKPSDELDLVSSDAPHEIFSKAGVDMSSSLARVLVGGVNTVSESYFPPNVIGGSCPRVVGNEEEIVWNAAAEACDSERVHVVWQTTEDRIWFLAVHSNDLASHHGSWCPFAAYLPGMRDALPAPVCYTYFGDEMATMMAISRDGLQVYRGTNLIVRAKAERTSRENNNAPIIELNPDRIQTLTPVPWYSLSLFEDRARRILALISIVFSLSVVFIAFLIWFLASFGLIAAHHNIQDALDRTQDKTLQMMDDVQHLRASPMRDQIATFTDLNDGLLDLNGYLEVYELRGNKPRWRALVPSNVTADRINALGGKTIETRAEGTVIGNAAEIEYETQQGPKK